MPRCILYRVDSLLRLVRDDYDLASFESTLPPHLNDNSEQGAAYLFTYRYATIPLVDVHQT